MNIKKTVIRSKLLESSLSRLWKTMQERETGIITAFRNEYSYGENVERNKALLTDLRRYFDVTALKGSYIQNYGTPGATPHGENVFFVSANDNKYLKEHLQSLGEKYEQDSILYIPKGGQVGYIIGTKKDVWPGYGQEQELGNPIFGKSGEFYSSVRGRPFVLQNKITEQFLRDGPKGFFGEWCRYLSTCKYEKKKK